MFTTFAAAGLGTTLLLVIGLCGYKALYSDVFGLDRMLAAGFFHAEHGETISLIVAQWNDEPTNKHHRAGCRWCAFLNVFVEKDHCAKQLERNAGATPLLNGMRAGICLLALAFVLTMVPEVLGYLVLAAWTLVP